MPSRTLFASLATALALSSIPAMAQIAEQVAPMRVADDDTPLRSGMRKLWEDHITWTRLFIISTLADLPDQTATSNRLLKNQVEIGDAIRPFYGDAAGDRLTALLRDHVLIAADAVIDAKNGQASKLAEDKVRWAKNADEIAAFLSGANPGSWPPEEMKRMMRAHLDATTSQLLARVKKDWAADVDAYETLHDQALRMADLLADGIARQYPEKVKVLMETLKDLTASR